MKYQQYLKSEHWIKFRKSIYSIRKQCQYCCRKNVKLNIHHKNYFCIGKETNEDVIVLCEECHFSLHKKKKWIKAKNNRESMNFTVARNTERKIYNASDIKRLCTRCGEEHPIFYKRFKNGKIALGIACYNSKPRVTFIKFEPDLEIPILE